MSTAVVKKALPPSPLPSSSFPALLRRSNFASYDPAIRQAYSASPDHAQRGSWGLKRPLPLRRRDAFISLPAGYETRGQFVDWANAESQVRFIRRFREMEAYPTLDSSSPWYKVLGSKNTTQWLIDSEFCDRQEGPEVEEWEQKAQPEAKDEAAESSSAASEFSPTGAGKGAGGYGANRAARGVNSNVCLNINAMSNKEFERYLKKLRKMRPAFQEHLEEVVKETSGRGPSRYAGKSLYELATAANLHRFFLTRHYSRQFNSTESKAIEPRPHLNGGLSYARLSELHTQLYARLEPGFALHEQKIAATSPKRVDLNSNRHQGPDGMFVVSYGGLSSSLSREDARQQGRDLDKVPLFDYASEKGFNSQTAGHSVLTMRLKHGSVRLLETPKVVGRKGEGLKAVDIRTEVTTKTMKTMLSADNPHPPGSWEYMTMKGRENKYDLEPAPFVATQKPFKPMPKVSTEVAKGVVINTLRGLLHPTRDAGL